MADVQPPPPASSAPPPSSTISPSPSPSPSPVPLPPQKLSNGASHPPTAATPPADVHPASQSLESEGTHGEATPRARSLATTPTLGPTLVPSRLDDRSAGLPLDLEPAVDALGLGLGLSDGLPLAVRRPADGSSIGVSSGGGGGGGLLLSALGSPSPSSTLADPRPSSSPPSRSPSSHPHPQHSPTSPPSSLAIGRAPSSGLFVSRTDVYNAAEHGPGASGGPGRQAVGDGTWTVSVASDDGAGARGRTKGKVCVYAQSATHNFTLLRTVKEIQETYDKLAAAHVSPSLPPFPTASLALLDPPPPAVPPSGLPTAPAAPAARKSSIRRAFSRLRDGSRDRSTSASASTPPSAAAALAPSALLSPPRSPQPAVSALRAGGTTPTIEEEDPLSLHVGGEGAPPALPPKEPAAELPPIRPGSPLLSPAEDGRLGRPPMHSSTASSSASLVADGSSDGGGGALSTSAADAPPDGPSPMASLSTLLTALANDRGVRESKVWRRFVRVRGDDMSSVRVERKIVRTHSAQGLHQSSNLSASLKGLGRSLRPSSRPSTADARLAGTTTDDELTDDGVLVEKDEGGAALPAEDNVDPTGTAIGGGGSGGGSPFGKKRRRRAAGAAAEVEPLQAPIRLLAKGEDPFAPTPPPTTAQVTPPPPTTTTTTALDAAPSRPSPATAAVAIEHSPSFPENDGRPSSVSTTAASSPLPPRPASADPDISYHKVLAAREAARQHAARDISSAAADTDDGSADARPFPAAAADEVPRKRVRIARRKVGIDDFELIRVLGKGCAGKVLLVRKKDRDGSAGGPLLALKSIVKRHVLAHQELQHTLTEQAVLRRMSRDVKNPFVVHLHYSFHDKDNLFLIMDFHPGGDLATQLARWGKFGRDRARFYAAEIVEGVQGLHAAGVIYRDLKPENILLDAAGHLVLTDFGLSKEFPRQALSSPPVALANGDVAGFDLEPEAPALPEYMQAVANGGGEGGMTDQQRLDWAPAGDRLADQTLTFCGTAEYLAPEVIQGLPYSYAVDWWSFGTLLYEMLVGMTPFWAQNHSDMYLRVLHDDLVFPDESPIDQDTKSLLRGLLQRDPSLRLSEPRIKRHPYFQMISWEHIYHKRYIPPYTPPNDPENAMDTQNFDEAFLDMAPTIDGEEGGDGLAAEPSAANAAAAAEMEDRASLWDGYSYRERDAASIFTLGSEQDGSYGRKSGELLRSSLDSARLVNGQANDDTIPATPRSEDGQSPVDQPAHEPEPSQGDSLDSVDRPPPAEASTSGSSLDESLADPPLSPVSVHAHIGRTGIAAVDRDRASVSESEADAALDEDSDDDWDVVEKPRAGLQDQNGSKGTTFFARGVVDRYRFGQIKKKESKALLARPRADPTPSVTPPTPTQETPTQTPTSTPPPSFSARRGLTFKGGRFRRKVNSDTQHLGELKTSPAALKNSKSTPSSLSRSPFTAPSASPSLPSGLATPVGDAPPASPQRELPPRSASVSPTKASSGRMASATASEDDAAGAGSRISSGEKLKLFGRSGQEKVLNLFKA